MSSILREPVSTFRERLMCCKRDMECTQALAIHPAVYVYECPECKAARHEKHLYPRVVYLSNTHVEIDHD